MFYKLRGWVDKDKLNWHMLCANPCAIDMIEEQLRLENSRSIICRFMDWLKERPSKINWNMLSVNPNAIHILEKNEHRIRWEYLSLNINALRILERHPDKVDWKAASDNPGLVPLLEKHQDRIYWRYLSRNPNAIHLLEANPDKISWDMLSENPSAIHLLEANPEKINWYHMSINPNAIHLLKRNSNQISWEYLAMNPNIMQLPMEILEDTIVRGFFIINKVGINLSKNPNAVDFLRKYRYMINYRYLWRNPNAASLIQPIQSDREYIYASDSQCIFEYDYQSIKEVNESKNRCVVEWFNHPRIVSRFINEYGMDILDNYEQWLLDRHCY
jgi:hypothetical protein